MEGVSAMRSEDKERTIAAMIEVEMQIKKLTAALAEGLACDAASQDLAAVKRRIENIASEVVACYLSETFATEDKRPLRDAIDMIVRMS